MTFGYSSLELSLSVPLVKTKTGKGTPESSNEFFFPSLLMVIEEQKNRKGKTTKDRCGCPPICLLPFSPSYIFPSRRRNELYQD